MEKQEIINKIEKKEKELKELKGTPCSIYSRVVGYFSVVSQWNNGKAQEFKDRVMFDESVKK